MVREVFHEIWGKFGRSTRMLLLGGIFSLLLVGAMAAQREHIISKYEAQTQTLIVLVENAEKSAELDRLVLEELRKLEEEDRIKIEALTEEIRELRKQHEDLGFPKKQ